MIRDNDQFGGIRERNVFRKQARIDVPMRTDKGEFFHSCIEASRHAADRWICVEISIWIKHARDYRGEAVQSTNWTKQQIK